MWGFHFPEYFIIIDFFHPIGYKKRTYQNPATNNRSTKMGVTEEGSSMIDEKNKAGLPDKKVKDLFYFGTQLSRFNMKF